MNVIVDGDKCVGSGQCAMTAPNVFDQSDSDGLVVLLDEAPPEAEMEIASEAVVLCPAAAIRLQEGPAQ
ncbi:ferredoxin [Kribbella sp. NBC_01505]|uniref:ferredoxin n=1 Tax=Kribbella sp. NBC_01505 TaxID=2903580 RepID=UPI00386AB046